MIRTLAHNLTRSRGCPSAGGVALVFLVILALCIITPPATADTNPTLTVPEMDSSTRRGWNAAWRIFAADAMPYEDDYVVVPGYNPRFLSSAQLTPALARRRLDDDRSRQSGVDPRNSRGRNAASTRPPEIETLLLSRTLPRFGVGQYGMVHSVKVKEVLGPLSMIVTDLWLIDADAVAAARRAERQDARKANRDFDRDLQDAQYFIRDQLIEQQRDRKFRVEIRLEGFPTRGLGSGRRYFGPNGEGLHAVFAKVELATQTSRSGRRTRQTQRAVLLPVDEFRRNAGLTEPQFADLLTRRDLSPRAFVDLVHDARREDRDTALDVVFDRLLPPIPKPERDK